MILLIYTIIKNVTYFHTMIKFLQVLVFLFSSPFLFAQDTLVLVDRIYPKDELTSFPDYWQGVYRNDRGVTWEVTPKSINSISNLYMAFTKKELLDKEGYAIENGLLYGFVEDDSIPVFERNDSVFFAYRHRKELFEVTGNNVLTKEGKDLIFYRHKKTTMSFEIILLKLNKGTLEVHYMDAEKVKRIIEEFRPTPDLEKGEFTFYSIKNKRKNFEILSQDEYFELGMALEFQEKLE